MSACCFSGEARQAFKLAKFAIFRDTSSIEGTFELLNMPSTESGVSCGVESIDTRRESGPGNRSASGVEGHRVGGVIASAPFTISFSGVEGCSSSVL